jgi:hypothetical protein
MPKAKRARDKVVKLGAKHEPHEPKRPKSMRLNDAYEEEEVVDVLETNPRYDVSKSKILASRHPWMSRSSLD